MKHARADSAPASPCTYARQQRCRRQSRLLRQPYRTAGAPRGSCCERARSVRAAPSQPLSRVWMPPRPPGPLTHGSRLARHRSTALVPHLRFWNGRADSRCIGTPRHSYAWRAQRLRQWLFGLRGPAARDTTEVVAPASCGVIGAVGAACLVAARHLSPHLLFSQPLILLGPIVVTGPILTVRRVAPEDATARSRFWSRAVLLTGVGYTITAVMLT